MKSPSFLSLVLVNLIAQKALTLNSFDRTLSPRQVKTKYGFLRGILISPPTPRGADVPSPASPSAPSSASSSRSQTPSAPSIAIGPVEAFLGVPFAAPPIGSLRFMPPVTPSHWRGTRMANNFGHVCPQKYPDVNRFSEEKDGKVTKAGLSLGREEHLKRALPFLDNQSEDCLYHNIYHPYRKDTSQKLPVIVFIHGESYNWGSGNPYDGTVLASYGGVVVVTLNYRLGVFGFLPTTIDNSKRGNYALMDVIAALHWVQDNVNEIGGDPNNVTLVGHNRGAALVNLLMLSPMARGLFSKGALLSGSALSSWAISRDSDSYSRYLSKAVNCGSQDNIMLLQCLRSKTLQELVKVDFETEESFKTTFGPIIDGLLVPVDPRILMESENDSTHHLSYRHPTGRAQNVGQLKPPHPLLFGVTRIEAPFLFSDLEEKQGIDLSRRDAVLRSLLRNVVDYYQEVILLALINEYTDWSLPSEHPINIFDSLVDILGDALIVAPLVRAADLHFNHQRRHFRPSPGRPEGRDGTGSGNGPGREEGSRCYSYVFVYQSESSRFSPRLGCIHGEDLPYLFGAPIASLYVPSFGFFPVNYSTSEVTLSQNIINYFINFAKFGSPNGVNEKVDGLQWPEYDVSQKKYLMIGNKPKVRDHYHSHRLSFWSNLIPKLQIHGKEESDHLKSHLQDQVRGSDNPNEVAVFQRISLSFLNSLETPSDQRLGLQTPPPSGTSLISQDQVSQGLGQTLVPPKSSPATPEAVPTETEYSTALTITIAIGLSLLILNVMVFAGVYYKLHKGKEKGPKGRKTVNGSKEYMDVPQNSFSEKGANECQQFYCREGNVCLYSGPGESSCCPVKEALSCPDCSEFGTCRETVNESGLSVIQEMDEHL